MRKVNIDVYEVSDDRVELIVFHALNRFDDAKLLIDIRVFWNSRL